MQHQGPKPGRAYVTMVPFSEARGLAGFREYTQSWDTHSSNRRCVEIGEPALPEAEEGACLQLTQFTRGGACP